MTQAQQAFELYYGVDGDSRTARTWTEVGDEMGLTRIQAKNAGYYWRKRDRVSRDSRARYANDPEYRAKKLRGCKEYRERDPEAYRAIVKARRDANPEHYRALKRANSRIHAPRTNAIRRDRYANEDDYRELMKTRALAYRDANLDKCRESSRRYQAEHKEERAAYAKEWRANGGAEWERQYKASRREHNAVMFRRWLDRNAEKCFETRRKYRFKHRPKLLMARSVWQFGPVWGPVHRAINDLKARIREERQ